MPGTQTDPQIAAKAMGMADAGFPPSVIGKALGKPRSTISEIINLHGCWGKIAEKPVFERWRREQQQLIEASSRQIAAEALEQTQIALPKASALQAATVFAIMVDKSRLLAGESTANLDVHIQVQGLDELASALGQALLFDPTKSIPK